MIIFQVCCCTSRIGVAVFEARIARATPKGYKSQFLTAYGAQTRLCAINSPYWLPVSCRLPRGQIGGQQRASWPEVTRRAEQSCSLCREPGYLPPVLAADVLYDTTEASAAHSDVILTSSALSPIHFNFLILFIINCNLINPMSLFCHAINWLMSPKRFWVGARNFGNGDPPLYWNLRTLR